MIFASNDLDERLIESLKEQGATIAAWGVGTRLVTAFDHPALGCVYKLSAVRDPGGPWQDRLKLSEQAGKTSIPGILQVRRYFSGDEAVGNAIYDERRPCCTPITIVDPADPTRRKSIPAEAKSVDLLVPIFRSGRRVYAPPSLEETRSRVRDQLACFHSGVKRFVNPHRYPAGLELGLHDRRTEMVLELRAHGGRL